MSDLNNENEIDITNVCNELHEDPIIPDNDDIQMGVHSMDVAIDDMEKSLAVGEIVKDEDIAYALYCRYARLKGFSVRKGRNYPFRNGGGLQAKEFLCSREGVKDEKRSKDKIPDYQKTDCRCNCPAEFKVGRTRDGPWIVKKFIKDHNHDMFAPDQTYLLRSSRHVTNEQELMLATMVNAKIPISRAINVLENVAGGRENVGFTPRDAYDCMSRLNRKSKMENRDVFELMQHFKNKANSEPDFFWDFELDDDNRLLNFFIRDSRCLIDYGHFSDVVSFDTTYRTNIFDMICGPIVGINHHNENILFGFAILSDETEITFTWLFKTFLKSMGEKKPGMIFTDQCQAMMNAVKVVFNGVPHCLCQWHINQNAPSHFGKLNSDSNFKDLWKKCMSYCESEEEFEATWKEMVEKYGVGEQNWFNMMYKLRDKWSTAFRNTKFSAGLMTTSRSEGTNSAFKRYIKNKNSSLLDCVMAYEKVQDDWRRKEKENDTLCYHNKPSLFVSHPLLKQAADSYTINMFKVFEKELRDTIALAIPEKITYDDSPIVLYKVKPFEGTWFRTVEYDSKKMEIKCSCHRTETVGILCRHALKVFDVVHLRFIPDKYILKRWCKRAKSELYVSESDNMSSVSDTTGVSNYLYEIAFVSHATKELRELAIQGKRHVDARNIVMKHIENAKKEMSEWFEKNNINDSTILADSFNNNAHDNIVVRDPLLAKSRGATDAHKRFWEAKSKKGKGKGKGKGEGEGESGVEGAEKRKGKGRGKGVVDNSKRTTRGGKRTCPSSQEPSPGQNSQRIFDAQHFLHLPRPVFNQPNVQTFDYPFSFANSSFTNTMPLRAQIQPLQYPVSFVNSPSSAYMRPVIGGATNVQQLHSFSFQNLNSVANNNSEHVNMLRTPYSKKDFNMSQEKK